MFGARKKNVIELKFQGDTEEIIWLTRVLIFGEGVF